MTQPAAPNYEPPVSVEPMDLLAPRAEPLDAPHPGAAPSIVSRLIYLALLVLPALLAALVLLARAGVISPAPREGKAPWELGVLILNTIVVAAVAGVIARRVPTLAERGRREDATDAALARWELRALVWSLPPAAILMALAYAAWLGAVPLDAPDRIQGMTSALLATLALLAVTGPLGWFSFVRGKQIREMEARFPDFLRDLNESHGAGLTMAQAIRVAARGDYGRLNPEIRRMAHQVSWGTPFNDAMKMFADRVGTPIVVRAVALINKATRAGGNVKDVLAAAARDAREVQAIQQERQLGMTLYVIVIYVAFGVFLSVVGALQGLLVPALLRSTGAGGEVAGLLVNGGATFLDFRYIYFGVGLVQAIGSGIVAGVMAEGSYSAGVKHAVVMSAITLVVLGVLL